MGRRRKVDGGLPDFIERPDRGPHHAGQALDVLELAKIRFRKTQADSFPKAIRIDRRQKAAGQSRCHLAHREDLDTVCVVARRIDPGHMSGESRLQHDHTPHVFHFWRPLADLPTLPTERAV
jgi:hypothetical protein